MMIRLSSIVGVVALLIAPTHALRGGSSSSSRTQPNRHRQLDRFDDLSESSLDETIDIDADNYVHATVKFTGVNPDSGDEDYSIHEWDFDPLDDDALEVDAVEVDAAVDGPIIGNATATNTTGTVAKATSACVECTNIPTPYMLRNNFPCND